MAAPQEYTAQNPEPFQSQMTQRAPGFFWFYMAENKVEKPCFKMAIDRLRVRSDGG